MSVLSVLDDISNISNMKNTGIFDIVGTWCCVQACIRAYTIKFDQLGTVLVVLALFSVNSKLLLMSACPVGVVSVLLAKVDKMLAETTMKDLNTHI